MCRIPSGPQRLQSSGSCLEGKSNAWTLAGKGSMAPNNSADSDTANLVEILYGAHLGVYATRALQELQ